MKKALIVGASGLIGSELVQLLISDNYYDFVDIWGRRKIDILDKKISEKIVDFDNLNEILITQNTDVYCCIGSTIKKAKTWDNFKAIDVDIPVKLADICEQYGIQKFIVISSIGASRFSKNKYLKMKGDMEFEISKRKIQSIAILRPSILLGNRKEFRFGERIGILFMQFFSFLLVGGLKKYKGITALVVAKGMVNAAKSNNIGIDIIESSRIK